MQLRARARELRIGTVTVPTPIVIPSFSSRAKPPTPLQEFAEATLPSIAGPILVSAYDVVFEPQLNKFDFLALVRDSAPAFVLLDSGGYEALWNRKAREAGLIEASDAQSWLPELHEQVLRDWPADMPLLAVTFDIPDQVPGSIEDQVVRGLQLASRFPHVAVELLIKPPDPDADPFLRAEAIAPHVADFKPFAMIGVTEDEIGTSMAERLMFLNQLRAAFDEADIDIPIHVFGGLDPVMTPLYFWAGADVFDGLSWLRYAYSDGRSLYAKSFAASHHPMDLAPEAYTAMRRGNIRALTDLQISMQQYLTQQEADVFGPSAERLIDTWDTVRRG